MFRVFDRQAENVAELQELIEKLAKADTGLNRFPVTRRMAVPLHAKVIREGEKQTVYLRSSERHVSLKRNTDRDPGVLSVTCPPDGETVPVSTINVSFRDIDDIYTDRGIAWVHPGTPAVVLFALTRRALDTPGLVAELAEAAVRAVDENVLKYFNQPVH